MVVQFQLASLDFLHFSIPNLGLKYFIGVALVTFFGYHLLLEIIEYFSGYELNILWYVGFSLSFQFSVYFFQLESRIQSSYFLKDTDWHWPVFGFCKHFELTLVFIALFFCAISIMMILEDVPRNIQSNTFLEYLFDPQMVVTLIPFSALYFFYLLLWDLDGRLTFPLSVWHYFPVPIVHELIAAWIIQTVKKFEDKKWLSHLLILLAVYKTFLLFGLRFNGILYISSVYISYLLTRISS
jgi:hypothetical protein